jgi:UDP-glucose 4-epimerase
MKYLVTGGLGFIGSHLVDELIRNGHQVVVVDDMSSGKKDNVGNLNKCELIIKTIQNVRSQDLNGIDGIFHLAAQASVPISIDEFYESSQNNILGCLKVFDLAKSFNIPVVYASSSAVYGGLPEGDDTINLSQLDSPYAVDKYCMEKYAEVANKLYKVSSAGLRFFNVYGPKQDPNNPYSGVIPIFIRQVSCGEKVTVNGGYQTRDFIFIRDIIDMILQAMAIIHKSSIAMIVNAGTGISITIDALLTGIAEVIGKEPKIEYRPLPLGDPEKSAGTYDKMVDFFGFTLEKFTRLEDGLKETIEYFQKKNNEI